MKLATTSTSTVRKRSHTYCTRKKKKKSFIRDRGRLEKNWFLISPCRFLGGDEGRVDFIETDYTTYAISMLTMADQSKGWFSFATPQPKYPPRLSGKGLSLIFHSSNSRFPYVRSGSSHGHYEGCSGNRRSREDDRSSSPRACWHRARQHGESQQRELPCGREDSTSFIITHIFEINTFCARMSVGCLRNRVVFGLDEHKRIKSRVCIRIWDIRRRKFAGEKVAVWNRVKEKISRAFSWRSTTWEKA